MEDLKKKYCRIKYLLSDISNNLDALSNEELFFDTLKVVKKDVEEMQFLKKELKLMPGKSLVKNIDGELDLDTKQIKDKFDSIIRIKKFEIAEVQMKLINLQNSKKLIKYYRD